MVITFQPRTVHGSRSSALAGVPLLHTLLLVLVVSGSAQVRDAVAQSLPLEITNIRPNLSPASRISRAYPELEYNIRAAVVGGEYPYTFVLQNAPTGMTIDASRGSIVWSKPQQDANPTLVVTDAKGARTSVAWSIRVSPMGFRFIDGMRGVNAAGNGCSSACGTGAPDKPWRSISDLFHNGKAGEIVYFRTGTYALTDLPRDRPGSPWERVEFDERQRPVVWLAAPEERPTIDFGYQPNVVVAPILRFGGDNVYLDGFETKNSHLIAFQFVSGSGSGFGPTFRRLRMHTHGPGIDGGNAAFIMTLSGQLSRNGVIQDCEFFKVTGASVTIKIYAQSKLLIEDTVHHDTPVAIELKSDVREFTVRHNSFYRVAATAIGGNMHESTTSGEILFNNVHAGIALDLNQDGMAGRIHTYRNTFVGRVQIRNTDRADGPFVLTNNIIVTEGSRGAEGGLHREHVTPDSRIVASNNIMTRARDGLVDAEGLLTKKGAQLLGTHGHELPANPKGVR